MLEVSGVRADCRCTDNKGAIFDAKVYLLPCHSFVPCGFSESIVCIHVLGNDHLTSFVHTNHLEIVGFGSNDVKISDFNGFDIWSFLSNLVHKGGGHGIGLHCVNCI